MLGRRQGAGLVGGLFGAFSLVVACGESEPRSPAGGAGAPDTQYEGGAFPFATIQQEAWSTPVAFDPSQLLGVTVIFPPGSAFNAALDDVTFY